MKKINQKNLQEALKEYYLLSESDRKEANKKLSFEWIDAFSDFNAILKQDPYIDEAISKIGSIKNIIRFNEQNEFVEFDYMAHEGDPEYEEPVYKYSKKIHDKEKYTAENWEQIQQKYNDELKKLEDGSLVPFRDKRIDSLKKKFAEAEKMAEHYKYVQNTLAEQKFLHEHPEILQELETKLHARLEKYAKDFLPAVLEKSPQLICYEHTTDTTIYKDLVRICNELRAELLENLRNKNSIFSTTGMNQQ